VAEGKFWIIRKFINKVLTHFDAEIVRKSLHQKLVQKQNNMQHMKWPI